MRAALSSHAVALGYFLCSLCLPTVLCYKVRVGYNTVANPSKLAMNRGLFEKETGSPIEWHEVPRSYKSIIALANDELDMTVANSVDIARAMTRRLPIKLVWVVEELWSSEALMVHNNFHVNWGGTVRTPKNLKGMNIGVTFGGTEHYALESYYKEMQVDIVTNSLYQMNGCRYAGPPHCQAKYLWETSNVTGCQLLEPCHYSPPTANSVNFIGMQRQELREAWNNGQIHAIYAGWQELDFYKQDGYILLTTQELANWGKSLFNGLLVSDKFLAKLDFNARNFTAKTILTFGKAHFYYTNNTKEFQVSYAGKESVSARIESVSDVDHTKVAEKLTLLNIPTMEEQIGCRYLGCGSNGGIARALRDQAKFCSEIKYDSNNPTILKQDLLGVQLIDYLSDYSPWITPFYIKSLLDLGINASYFLAIGDKLHLGYQITANYGRTVSIITT